MTQVLAAFLSLSMALGTTPDVQTMDRTYTDAQAFVGRYGSSRDPSDLRQARDLLVRWLADHEVRYGTGLQAEASRAPVRTQVSQIDAVLATSAPPPPPPPAAPVVVQTPAPAAPLPAAPPPSTVDRERASARRQLTAGAVLLPVGAVVGAAIALPLWVARDRALERADDERFRVDQEGHLTAARAAHASGWIFMGFGIAMMTGGIALLAVGGAKQARLNDVAIAPTFGPRQAGLTARLRF